MARLAMIKMVKKKEMISSAEVNKRALAEAGTISPKPAVVKVVTL